MPEIQCPACGSREVDTTHSEQSYSAPFGGTKVFRVQLDTCRTCGESGDFTGANAAIVKGAIDEADRESIARVLDALSEAGISAAFLERALSLPARTVARWKAGGSSASGLALLRLVRTFPWLVGVAAARFSEAVAKRALVEAAALVIQEAVAASGFQYSVAARQPGEGVYEFRTTLVATPGAAQAAILKGPEGTIVTQKMAA